MTRVWISAYSYGKEGTKTVDSDLRASLVAAGGAFLLSALVGLFARVAFFVLLGRALFGGLLLGALAYGAIRLVHATLPSSEARETESQEPRGRNLDNVLPEEMPDSFAHDAGASDLESLNEDVAVGDVGVAPMEAFPGRASDMSKPSQFSGSASGSMATRAFAAYEEDEAGEPESLLDDATESDSPISETAASPLSRGAESLSDLDVLPDLEGFTDSFAASEFGALEPESERESPAFSGRAASGRRSDSGDLDPATLAQAVRTILKRDRKG